MDSTKITTKKLDTLTGLSKNILHEQRLINNHMEKLTHLLETYNRYVVIPKKEIQYTESKQREELHDKTSLILDICDYTQ